MRVLVMPGDGIGPEITPAALTVAATASRRWRMVAAISRRASAWGSTSLPISGRRGRGQACRTTCPKGAALTWSSCARPPRAAMPTATWRPDRASARRARTWRSRPARSRGTPANGSRGPRSILRARRKNVTAIHKANCFLMTDGPFLEAVRSVAQDLPDVELEDLLVDASTAHMVRSPERFDVLCSTNCGDFGRHVAARVAR